MQTLIHLPLEPYKSRYTENLHVWEKETFSKNFDVAQIIPDAQQSPLVLNIAQGEVLDSLQRPLWALAQIRRVLQERSPVPHKFYFSDFYHPGLDALAYSRRPFTAYAFLWAQTFDQFDFTQRFIDWMRAWEHMAFAIYKRVFVASAVLADLITSAIPDAAAKIHVVGLPFDSTHVTKLIGYEFVDDEEYDVVYTSRWDEEKQPEIFLALVRLRSDLKFAVCTGQPELKGTASKAVLTLKAMASGKHGPDNVTLFENCSKAKYYAVLSKSRVQLNTSLQDWVSFTLLEALTFGCQPLYPNFRSFPEALHYDDRFLYPPGDVTQLSRKLNELLSLPRGAACPLREPVLTQHDGTLNRISTIIQND